MPSPDIALVVHVFSHSTAEQVFAALTDLVMWGLCIPVLHPSETRTLAPGSIWHFDSDEYHCDQCEPPKSLLVHTKDLRIHFEVQELAAGTMCQAKLEPANPCGVPLDFFAKRTLRFLEDMEKVLGTIGGRNLARVNLATEVEADAITVVTKVEVHSPPQAVFDLLINPHSWDDWQGVGRNAKDRICISGPWPEANSSLTYTQVSGSWIERLMPWSKGVARVLAYHANQRFDLEKHEGSQARVRIENEIAPSLNGAMWTARHKATCHLPIGRRIVFKGICLSFPWDMVREAAALTAVCEADHSCPIRASA